MRMRILLYANLYHKLYVCVCQFCVFAFIDIAYQPQPPPQNSPDIDILY